MHKIPTAALKILDLGIGDGYTIHLESNFGRKGLHDILALLPFSIVELFDRVIIRALPFSQVVVLVTHPDLKGAGIIN